jgi:hypothetical protein
VAEGSYSIQSNCPSAKTSGSINVKEKTFYSTTTYNYDASGSTDFGLPNDTWSRTGQNLSSVGSSRTCSAIVLGEKIHDAAFMCRNLKTNEGECTVVVNAQ